MKTGFLEQADEGVERRIIRNVKMTIKCLRQLEAGSTAIKLNCFLMKIELLLQKTLNGNF